MIIPGILKKSLKVSTNEKGTGEGAFTQIFIIGNFYFAGLNIRSTTSAFLNMSPAIFFMSLTVNAFNTFS